MWRVENEDKDIGEEDAEQQLTEIFLLIEKGSPAEKVLQVLKHHQFEAEVTAVEVKGGSPGRHQLVKVEGVFCDRRAGSAFTFWAIILPSGIAYLLSA